MRSALPLLVLAPLAAQAEVPNVVADIAPVHSLVALAMGDLGEPVLVLPPGTSPHHASLAPSAARALSDADLVVWTGSAYAPWMAEAVASLAGGARSLPLLESPGWEPLPARGGHHHDDEEHEDDTSHEGHDHEASDVDPHAWLDPGVAVVWLDAIAVALAEADPENAATYRANADAAAAGLLALGEGLPARMAPVAAMGLAVGHDAYAYFERAAGLPPSLPITGADGGAVTPGDAAALREAMLAGDVGCLVLDAETSPDWAGILGEGTDLRTAVADPDGVRLTPGPDLYPALIEGIAVAMESCLRPS